MSTEPTTDQVELQLPLINYIAIEVRTYEAADGCYEHCEVDVPVGKILQITSTQAYYLNKHFKRTKQRIHLMRIMSPPIIDVEKLVSEEMAYDQMLLEKQRADSARANKEQIAKKLAATEKKAAKMRKLLEEGDKRNIS